MQVSCIAVHSGVGVSVTTTANLQHTRANRGNRPAGRVLRPSCCGCAIAAAARKKQGAPVAKRPQRNASHRCGAAGQPSQEQQRQQQQQQQQQRDQQSHKSMEERRQQPEQPQPQPQPQLPAQRWLSRRAQSFSPSVIVEMSRLALQKNAINLAEGFPDFPAPIVFKDAAEAAVRADLNQYRYDDDLAALIARKFAESSGLTVEPSQVAISVGQSCALASTLLAVVDPGDEVMLLDPSFEAYRGAVLVAGGVPVHVPLRPPLWTLETAVLEAAITLRTKAIIVNSPCNPTGRVFEPHELSAIAEVCERHDLLAITDEVYEHFVFTPSPPHTTLASLPGMSDRTVVTSSMSKTFEVTGWRIGWAIAPPSISSAIGAISAKLVDSPPAPFQEAAKVALQAPPAYYHDLQTEYERRRNFTLSMLQSFGLETPCIPAGGFFVFAKIPDHVPIDDVELCRRIIERVGVAFVPGRIFFAQMVSHGMEIESVEDRAAPIAGSSSSSSLSSVAHVDSDCHQTTSVVSSNATAQSGSVVWREHERYIRVAFCKSMSTLEKANTALAAVRIERLL